MDPRDKETILNNRKQLIEATQWSPDLEAALITNGVFKSKMLDNVKKGDDDRVGRLYEYVLQRGTRAFDRLVAALTESGNSEAASLLNPTVDVVEDDALPFAGMAAGDASEKVWNPPRYSVPPVRSSKLFDNSEEVLIVDDDDKTPLEVQVKRATHYTGPPDVVAYPMTKKLRGQCLIIDNEKFVHDVRTGSEIDSKNLEILFQQLDFNVTVKRNLGFDDMQETLRAFALLPEQKDADMCIVAILSHGENGVICATDGMEVAVEWVLRTFNNFFCPMLTGKPKFFIFQSCRGDEHDYGSLPVESPSSVTCSTDALGVPPPVDLSWEDMLVLFATLPGFVAARDTKHGTWLVQCLCKVFMNRACDLDIRDMLDLVATELKKYERQFGNQVAKQSCTYECRHFYKKLFFNPGMYQEEEAKGTHLETQLDQMDIKSTNDD